MTAAAHVIVGSDEFLVGRAVHKIAMSAGSDEIVEVQAADLDVNEFRELTSPSLFGDARVLIIRDFQDAAKDLVAAAVEGVGDGSVQSLIVTHAGGAKGKPSIESLRTAGASVTQVEAPKSVRDREQWVSDEARSIGGSIDRAAVTELMAAVGSDLREIATVVAQLVADAGPAVDADDVNTYHRGRAELSGFTVADRAVEGQIAGSLEAVRWALATGVEPVLISSALAANLRLIGQVAGASRTSPEALASALRQPPWKIRRALGWVRRWRPEALAAAFAAVAAADADVKGGGDNAAYSVERAVGFVAAACS